MTRDNTSAKEKLITEHLALVTSIAHKLADKAPKNISRDELIAFGREGLVEAAQRYEPERGVAFSTFAYYRVRGAIFDGIRKLGPVIRLGHRAAFEEKADLYLEQRSTEPAPETAVAAAERLSEMVSDLATAYVITTRNVGERADESIPDPSQVLEKREEMKLVRENFSRLPEREQQLLTMIYFEDNSLVEAAKKLEMSKSWASRIHARALTRLRKGTVPTPPTNVMMRV